MKKLKSSIKSLQETITHIQTTIGPTCINETKTLSFRDQPMHHYHDALLFLHHHHDNDDDYHNCHCIMMNSPAASSSSSISKPSAPHDSPSMIPLEEEEEDFIGSETTTTTATTSSSSTRCEALGDELPSAGSISSERFFFTPRTSKSIMEEGSIKVRCNGSFCNDSLRVEMSSDDPFYDFRSSMEEMVVAHEVREWQGLQELLHCYLRLNEKKNHKVIVLAFVDLLMQLFSQDKDFCLMSSA